MASVIIWFSCFCITLQFVWTTVSLRDGHARDSSDVRFLISLNKNCYFIRVAFFLGAETCFFPFHFDFEFFDVSLSEMHDNPVAKIRMILTRILRDKDNGRKLYSSYVWFHCITKCDDGVNFLKNISVQVLLNYYQVKEVTFATSFLLDLDRERGRTYHKEVGRCDMFWDRLF